MANQITDGRTLITNANAVTGWVNLSGAAAGTLDTEIFIFGTGSIAKYCTSTRDGMLFDMGAAQDWTNNTFYLWFNCGIAGLLASKAAGGVTVRFCGATVSDWFEVYIAGSDDYPGAVSGGWAQLVVNIETARSEAVANSWTSGTVPATSAIRYVGTTFVTGGTMPRMADNTWADAIWRLPASSPGIIIEGRNGGTSDWEFGNIATTATTGAWGSCRLGAGGAIVFNTPIQFGINDATTHGFSDNNKVVLWDDQEFIPNELYGFDIIGGSTGSQNYRLGNKNGTGNDATGNQGCVIAAASDGARWYLNADNANITTANLYGCQFFHGAGFALNSAAVETVTTLFADCSSANVRGSLFLRNTVVNANTTAGTAFLATNDISDIKLCALNYSAGHAVELGTALVASQTSDGNTFSGYLADDTTGAAVYNNSGGAVEINVVGGGGTPTVRNGTGASTVVNNNVQVTLTGLQTNTEVRVYFDVAGYNGDEIAGVENSTTSFSFTVGAEVIVNIMINHLNYLPADIWQLNSGTTDATIPISQFTDRQYAASGG